MKPFAFLPLIALLLFAAGLKSQVSVPVFGKQTLINGYSETIEGETINYFSVYPKYAKQALLTRATDGRKAIEWITDTIPRNTQGDYAYFTWIAAHSTGTSSGARNFDLYVNDHYALTFTTNPRQYPAHWRFAGPDSTAMVFEYRTIDGAGDAHGMAYLRVPLSKYPPGRPLRLKVVGQHQESNDWYMTFKYAFREKLEVRSMPFILRDKGRGKQLLRVTALHFGPPENLEVTVGQDTPERFTVTTGFNVFDLPVPAVQQTLQVQVKAVIKDYVSMDSTVLLRPVTPREICLIHHAHTDIGYSHIQEDVIKIHNANIRRAMRLIEKTRDYPDGSRFVWNIESAWAVENFLQSASAGESEAFFRYVRDGQIVISATYANVLTGLCTPEEMDWITAYARTLRDQYGLPVKTGMMSDIPGMNWGMVSALAKNGVRYFSNGPNFIGSPPYYGDRIGNTLLEQGDRAFWWKSQDGRDSILFWTAGKGYSSWHGTPEGGVAERGADKIADYMDELEGEGYPWTMVQWRYNIVSDNGPTDSTISDFVRNWNEKYASPKLVLANVTEMFQRFEKLYGGRIPTLRGDFTPYWEDGAYSTAKEEGDARLASEKILRLERLAAQNGIKPNPGWLYRAKRDIVLWHEHTWGAYNSISEPDNPFVVHQWNYKKAFLDSAILYIRKLEGGMEMQLKEPGKIKVYNTLDHPRSGYAETELPGAGDVGFVVDDKGKRTPVQHLSDGRICFIAKDIPANGVKVFALVTGKKAKPVSFPSPLQYTINASTGAVASLRTRGVEWVNDTAYKGIGQVLYVNGTDPSKFSSTLLENNSRVEDGPCRKTSRIACSLEGTNGVVYEITQYNGLPYLKFTVVIDKKAVRNKEALHIAFPFGIQAPRVRIGLGDMYITPEKGQISGANKDFFCAERWIDVSGMQNGVTISCPQGALYEVGSPIDEEKNYNGNKQWKKEAHSSGTVFLYAMNNYWHTNYRADQEGKAQFDFYLSFHGGFDPGAARQFGYEMTQPLVVVSN